MFPGLLKLPPGTASGLPPAALGAAIVAPGFWLFVGNLLCFCSYEHRENPCK